jgi:hypothetical protein
MKAAFELASISRGFHGPHEADPAARSRPRHHERAPPVPRCPRRLSRPLPAKRPPAGHDRQVPALPRRPGSPLAAGQRIRLRIKLDKATARRVRRALTAKRRALLSLNVVAMAYGSSEWQRDVAPLRIRRR